MPHEANIHPAQMQILQALLFVPEAKYSQLSRQTDLTSDHFNFHLQSLVSLGYVEKLESGTYTLTPAGKEHANKLDTDSNTIERQPKVTVLLNIMRHSDRGLEMLMQQRLKQPFYGYWGLPSGKIRWGETIIQTAQRELFEETGLTCAEPKFYGLYHKIDFSKETNELLEDKIFFEVLCMDPEGELKVEFPGGQNRFVLREEIQGLGNLFDGIEGHFDDWKRKEFSVGEKYHYYGKDVY